MSEKKFSDLLEEKLREILKIIENIKEHDIER
jgi:hypothetical protein